MSMRWLIRSGWPVVLLAAFFCSPGQGQAQLKAKPGDWPAWRGPDRTGLSTETGLLKQWPKEGPKQVWKATGLGDGYSTPAVAGGRVYVMGTKDGKLEVLWALDLQGKKLWSAEIGLKVGGHPGPKSTPTVDGERIYVLSSDGKLASVDPNGTIVWKKDLKKDFGGQSGGWAYTESPLIDGDTLVCTPGGTTHTLVGLDKTTGSVRWKAAINGLTARKGPYTKAAYSSIIVAEVDGGKQYIQFLSGGVVGVSAQGKLLWHYDAPANGTANCSTPIYADHSVLAASAYGTGGGRARITKEGPEYKAEENYFLKELQNHHGGMVLVDGYVYGTNNGRLLCVDFKTGKIVWQNSGVGKGSVCFADGHLYYRGERGPVALVEATPAGYKEKGRFDQPDRSKNSAWPHPVVAGGKLYLRDWDVLLCYDIQAK